MTSKFLVLLIVFVSIFNGVFAQNDDFQKGLSAYDISNYSESVSFLKQSYETAVANNDADMQIRAAAYLARSLRKANQKDAAISLILRKNWSESYSQASSKAKGEFEMVKGLMYYTINELDSAKTSFLEALSFFKIENDVSEQKLYTLNMLGNTFDEFGQYAEALEWYNKAVALNLELAEPRKRDLMTSYSNMGIIYRRMGEFDQALDYMIKDLEITQEILPDDEYSLAVSLFNIGSVYLDNGDFRRAIDYNLQALPAFVSVFGEYHINTSYVYNNLSGAFLSVSEYELALKYDQLSFSIKKKEFGDNHQDVALAYINSAVLYQKLGQYQKAYDLALRSFTIRQAIFGSENVSILNNYIKLAEISLQLGDSQKALDWARSGLDLLRKKHPYFYRFEAELLEMKARAESSRKRYDDALSDFKMAYTLLEERGGRTNFARQLLNIRKYHIQTLMFMYEANNQHEFLSQAASLANESLHLVSEIQNGVSYSSSLYGSSALIHDFLFLGADIFSTMFQHNNDLKYFEESLQYSERAKIGVLRKQVLDQQAKTFAGIPSETLASERKLNRAISELEVTILTSNPSDSTYTLLSDSLFKMRQERIAFVEALEKNYPEYYQLKYSDSILSLEEIRGDLNDGELMVEFLMSEEEMLVYALSSTIQTVHKVAIDESFFELIRAFRKSILYSDNQGTQRLGNELFETLFGEEIGEVIESAEKITFIPENRLTEIPFESLWIENRNKYVIQSSIVDYALSASFRPKKRDLNLNEYAGFAPVTFNESKIVEGPVWRSELVPLPNSHREVSRFAEILKSHDTGWFDLFSSKNIRTNLKNEATENRLKMVDLEGGILHLATHTMIERNNTNLSRIFMNQPFSAPEDGVLHQNEIFGHTSNAGLVILSSCASGMGKYVKGEGVLGLTHAFFYTGASRVMVTQWSVLDLSSAELMIRFAEELTKNNDPTVALTMAKRRMMESPHFSDPVHWAPFVLFQ